jgi:hemoglobin/transferrin/lactoferrin receptor protein
MQKIKYRPVEGIELQYGFYYSGTGTAPRYDRLIEYRNNRLRFAEWNYGPMLWRMHTLQANFLKPGILFDELKINLAYQNYEESRTDRQRNSNTRRNQTENVKAWSLNVDAYKSIAKGTLFYGLEWVNNQVNSRGENMNIQTGNVTPTLSRYPDGSSWSSLGMYGLYKINLLPQLTLNGGLRLNRGTAEATFDQELFPLPYDKADINNTALTPSTGLVWRPGASWQIHGNFSTGFRIPNIDDLGKLFESNPGNVVVPNGNLESEYALNYEIGIAKKMPHKYTLELIGFHTRLNRAIVRRPFLYNGKDSILFDGVYSQVDALQNIGSASIWGLQAHAAIWFSKNLSLYFTGNFITGKETDEAKNEQVALRHAPPFYGNSGIKYMGSSWQAEFFSQYNSKIGHEDLAPTEQSKTFIYAKDENGNTFSPGWHTFNFRLGYHWKKYGLNASWENITNRQYRTYSSGIVSAGSNLILSARINF